MMPAARATSKQPVSTVAAGKNDHRRPKSLRKSKRIISSRNVSEQQQQQFIQIKRQRDN
jgi:hypothetical protein